MNSIEMNVKCINIDKWLSRHYPYLSMSTSTVNSYST